MKNLIKIILAIIISFGFVLISVGISIPKLVPNVKIKINSSLAKNFKYLDFDKIVVKLPNRIIFYNVKFVEKTSSISNLNLEHVGKLCIKLDIFRILKTKNLDVKSILNLRFENIKLNIEKSQTTTDLSLSRQELDSLFENIAKIDYLPSLEFKNININFHDEKSALNSSLNLKKSTLKIKKQNKTVRLGLTNKIAKISVLFDLATKNLEIKTVSQKFFDLKKLNIFDEILKNHAIFPITFSSSGKFFSNLKIACNLYDILFEKKFEKINVNGNILIEKIDLNFTEKPENHKNKPHFLEKIYLQNLDANIKFHGNAYSIDSAFAMLNNAKLQFSLNSNKIFARPTEISGFIDDIDKINFDFLNENLKQKLQNIQISFLPISLNFNLKLKEGKYSGSVNPGFLDAKIASDYQVKIAPFSIKIINDAIKIDPIEINLKNIGQIYAEFVLSKKNMNLLLNSEALNCSFLIPKKFNFINDLQLKNFDFSILKNLQKSEKTQIILQSEIDLKNSEDFYELALNCSKTNENFKLNLSDSKTNSNILHSAGTIIDNKLIFDEFTLNQKNKILIDGKIPLNADENLDFAINFKKVSLDFFDYYIGKKNVLTDFDCKFNGTFNNLEFVSKLKIYDKNNYFLNTNICLKNKVLVANELFLDDNATAQFSYDFVSKYFYLYTKFTNFDLYDYLSIFLKYENKKTEKYSFFHNMFLSGELELKKEKDIDIKSTLKFSKQMQDNQVNFLFDLNSEKNLYYLKILNNNSQKGILQALPNFRGKKLDQLNISGEINDFVLNNKKFSLNLQNELFYDEQNAKYQGKLDIKNFHFNESKTSNLKTNYEYDYETKTFHLTKIIIDNNVFGNLKVEKNNKIAGELHFIYYNCENLLSILLKKNKFFATNFWLNGKLNFRGTTKSPIIDSKNFEFSFSKNSKKYLFKNNIFYDGKNLQIQNGNLFINEKSNLKYNLNSNKNNFKFGLDFKNFDSTEINNLCNEKIFLGLLTGKLSVENIEKSFNATSNLDWKNGSFAGFDIDKSSFDISFHPKSKKVAIKNAAFENKQTKFLVKENSYFDFSGAPQFDLKIYMNKWDLFGLAKGIGDITVDGKFSNELLSGDLTLSNFWINKYNFRDKKLKYNFKDGSIIIPKISQNKNLDGKITLKNSEVILSELEYKDLKSSLFVNGKIDSNDNLNILIRGKAFDLARVSKLLDIGLYVEGPSDFSVKVHGSSKSPEIDINIDGKNGKFEVLNFDTVKTQIYINKNSINIKNLELKSKSKYNISADGIIPFALVETEKKYVDKQKMSVKIKSSDANLRILEDLIGDTISSAKGKVSLDLELYNKINDIYQKGSLKIDDASFHMNDIFRNIKNFNSEIIFEANRFIIKNTEAKIGKSSLRIFGSGILKNFELENFDVSLETKGEKGIALEVRSLKIPQSAILKIIPASNSRADIKGVANIKGRPEKYKILANLTLEDAAFTYPPKENSDDTPDFLKNAEFDVKLQAGKNTWFENEFVNMCIEGIFTFKGPTKNLIVNGEINFLRGDLNFLGNYFRVKEGNFSVINNEPYVALIAESNIQREDPTFNRKVDDTIVLSVSRSKLSDLKLKFESTNFPNTSSQEAMGLAMSGGTFDKNSSSEDKELYVKREFFRLIDNTLTTPLVKVLVESTRLIDFVRVSTKVTEKSFNTQENKNASLFSGSSLTVGKYLLSNLFLSYAFGVDTHKDTENKDTFGVQHEIEAKYQIKKNLHLKGLVNIDQNTNREDKQIMLEYNFPLITSQEKKATAK